MTTRPTSRCVLSCCDATLPHSRGFIKRWQACPWRPRLGTVSSGVGAPASAWLRRCLVLATADSLRRRLDAELDAIVVFLTASDLRALAASSGDWLGCHHLAEARDAEARARLRQHRLRLAGNIEFARRNSIRRLNNRLFDALRGGPRVHDGEF